MRENQFSSNFIQIGLASSDEIKTWAERSFPSSFAISNELSKQTYIDNEPGFETLDTGLQSNNASRNTTLEPAEETENRNETIHHVGEVKKADTLNYRTFKPEKEGLFCEQIFGPVNDWMCSCGQLKEQRFALDHEKALKGKLITKICPNCLVEVTTSRFRRYRMGYIALACPVIHIWYLNSRPNLFSTLLKIPTKYIKKIAYYKAYSPSLVFNEYLSGLLAPGGDFFDNEWEFIHEWLSGKHFSKDVPSPWVSLFAGLPIDDFELQSKPRTDSNNKNKSEIHSQSEYTRSENGETKQSLNEQTGTNLNKSIRKANTRGAKSINKKKYHYFHFYKNKDGNLDYQYWRYYDLINPKKSNQSVVSQQLSAWLDVFAEQFRFANGATNKSERFGEAKLQHPNPKKKKIEKKIPSKNTFSKMPEIPNWLLNTGAKGLLDQLNGKNWKKEIQKLEQELSFPDEFLDEGEVLSLRESREESFSRSEKRNLQIKIEEISEGLDIRRKNRIRRLKILKTFEKGGLLTDSIDTQFSFAAQKGSANSKPVAKNTGYFQSLIFSNLPVLPPELRPIIQLGAGQLASSDVNDLYRRVLSRNNRLKYYLYETHFVEFLIRSEQQLVQLAVDALLENGKTTQVRHTSGQKRLYRSLSDRIGGKQGRFRMNLLGKRVDYSGRSVIVVGPKLHISNCGLPYEMAVELFQPFLLRHILELHLAKTIRSAKNILNLNKSFTRKILYRILESHPILLNRAPTLHRLGIQAFQPILVSGRAIHLHPLVCPAFNADFDGDQMAVHVPLSPQSQIEARLLMLSSGNWLHTATGQPNLLPSQDMVLGFYYMTLEKNGYGDFASRKKTTRKKTEYLSGYSFAKRTMESGLLHNSLTNKSKNLWDTITNVIQAYNLGILDLHSSIWLKLLNSSAIFSHSETGKAKILEANSVVSLQEKIDANSKNLRLRFQKKKILNSLTGDSSNKTGSPKKHILIEGFETKQSIDPFAIVGYESNQPIVQSNRFSFQKNRENRLFLNDSSQPLEMRIDKNSITQKIYSSYFWKEDLRKNILFSYIRTTPGRVLLNEMIEKYS